MSNTPPKPPEKMLPKMCPVCSNGPEYCTCPTEYELEKAIKEEAPQIIGTRRKYGQDGEPFGPGEEHLGWSYSSHDLKVFRKGANWAHKRAEAKLNECADKYLATTLKFDELVDKFLASQAREKELVAALRKISVGKIQEDIGLPPDSIAWRMMRIAQEALSGGGEK